MASSVSASPVLSGVTFSNRSFFTPPTVLLALAMDAPAGVTPRMRQLAEREPEAALMVTGTLVTVAVGAAWIE